MKNFEIYTPFLSKFFNEKLNSVRAIFRQFCLTLFMISGQIIGDYIIGDPILIPNKTPGKSRKYTHDLRCQYCDGQYVAPSRVALRKHVSRYHREVHRWVNEQSK